MLQSKSLLIIFHGSVVALDSYAIWYDQMYVDLPFPSKEIGELPLKARHIFLTVWCLVLQILYFFVSLLNDVYGTNSPAPKKPPFIRRVKDITFSLAFAVALHVSIAFWTLYAIHKDLIVPPEVAALIPEWINQVMHTLIVPFMLIELLVTRRNYPSRRFGLIMIILFSLTYTLWINTLYFKTGVWAYPFMDFLNWPLRIIFCITSIFSSLAFSILGERLDRLVAPSSKAYTNGVNGDVKRH